MAYVRKCAIHDWIFEKKKSNIEIVQKYYHDVEK